MVEQLTLNQWVEGSSPSGYTEIRTIHHRIVLIFFIPPKNTHSQCVLLRHIFKQGASNLQASKHPQTYNHSECVFKAKNLPTSPYLEVSWRYLKLKIANLRNCEVINSKVRKFENTKKSHHIGVSLLRHRLLEGRVILRICFVYPS